MDSTFVYAQNVMSEFIKSSCNLVCYPQVFYYLFSQSFYKNIVKTDCGVAHGLASKVYCLRTMGTKKPSHMGAFFCALRPSDTILFA